MNISVGMTIPGIRSPLLDAHLPDLLSKSGGKCRPAPAHERWAFPAVRYIVCWAALQRGCD